MLETERTRLHKLVDALPASKVEAANKYLEALANEVFMETLRKVPIDDEPLTKEDLEAIDEAEEAIAGGVTRDLDEVLREFRL